jgi:UDP-N-acetylglucosamine--N-acetylmuramyl-(pentapeptide) pyrophosphoryl-undecaprenol N-acetylglucosamine transferase
MERAGAAVVLSDSELEPERLAGAVGGLFAAEGRLEAMAAASRGLAMPDAARRIAEEILSAARGRNS